MGLTAEVPVGDAVLHHRAIQGHLEPSGAVVIRSRYIHVAALCRQSCAHGADHEARAATQRADGRNDVQDFHVCLTRIIGSLP